MRVVIHVAELHLRGIPFKRHESMLWIVLTEGYMPDEVENRPREKTAVSIDGQTKGGLEPEILRHAREIAVPDQWDGFTT